MSEAAVEYTACTKCENTEGPHYCVAENERLCPDCLAAEYERSLAVASAYVDFLKRKVESIRAMKDVPCPRCGDTGLVVAEGGGSARCPTCNPTPQSLSGESVSFRPGGK